MDLGLNGRVYLVTGASAGLGLATAQALVADGARVVICSRRQDRVDAAVAQLGTDQAVGVVADLADEHAASALVEAAMSRFDRLDGAVLSVGGPPPGTVTEATDDQWRGAFESVFLGPLRVARAVIAAPREDEDADRAVTFVLSTSVRAPLLPLGISNGLRPGLAMAAKSLADEHGKDGVRVNAVMPGRIDTDRIREIEEASGDAAAAREAAISLVPLGRIGQPEEFGQVAAFVTSPAASYLTGCAIPVDGGATRFM